MPKKGAESDDSNWVKLPPDATFDDVLDAMGVDKKTSKAKTKKTAAPKPKSVEIPTGDLTTEWTVAQLRAFAAVKEIDLGSLRSKSAIVAHLLDAIAVPDQAITESLADATERSIAQAVRHKILDPEINAGPIAALRVLAKKIDDADEMHDIALAYSRENKLRPPSIDNVSIPTYLKYCESLGLTAPKVAAGAGTKPEAGEQSGGSKLGNLRSIHGKGA